MKIIMDASPLVSRKTGIGYYTLNLVQHLAMYKQIKLNLAINGVRPSHSIPTDLGDISKILLPYDKLRSMNVHSRIYNLLKVEYAASNFDIFHGVNFHVWPTLSAKKIVTFHDLAFIKYPELMPKEIVKHHKKWAIHSLYNSDFVITVSQSVRQEIIDHFNYNPEKIACTPLAASGRFFQRNSKEELSKIKSKYKLPDSFFLYVGTIEPRKNILRLIEAFDLARKDFEFDQKLVLVGSKGIEFEKILQKINELNLLDQVIIAGYVEENDLPLIYNIADVFIYVSLYEGFGLPILEAMQSGLPVITSNLSSMPEVAGAAALLVNPFDTLSIAGAIAMLSQDANLRTRLSEQSLQQAGKFSWSLTAFQTFDIYNKVLK
ncbi:D-inositol 3-phosphate glycosyltransferase [Paenibacillus konkukensis]|uniref:D-inositol 3-phosphate glycosyltransferase n=2 Tax=Paenibacillus konkukensis TaxID=2020716 RepID=A0ABY4RPB8_9BACL|nr:D-inositol 3-phosphate glycosyltransferase [Paenibacillus konkukensis]